jgi:hypothetical protein
MTRILLFTENNCGSCESAERELKKLNDRRKDFNLVVFRRPEDNDKFRESNVVICPAVFVENRLLSYGFPDIRNLELILENSTGRINQHSKTKIKGDPK